MALLAARSKKALVFIVVPLLMTLLAASVSAGRSTFSMAYERCAKWEDNCNALDCGAKCAFGMVIGVGTCKVIGRVTYCCCVPSHPPSSIVVHRQLVH
ncbi:hypothetical protein EJB05_36992, partial [Eragrostis curvula]